MLVTFYLNNYPDTSLQCTSSTIKAPIKVLSKVFKLVYTIDTEELINLTIYSY